MSTLRTLAWVAVPYATIAVFVVGHAWRYRTAQYTWTTRSSQLLERKWLRIGSIAFHIGMLMVVGGHVGGLLVPKRVTEAVGISESMYHDAAIVMGTVAGLLMVGGLLILVMRRTSNARVRAASIGRDYLVAAMLVVVTITGMINTIGVQLLGDSHDYRESVSPWFRSVLTFRPDADLMIGTPWSFKLHALAAMALFALWPFTRLVHAWSVPLTYITRPYIVFRRRDSVAR